MSVKESNPLWICPVELGEFYLRELFQNVLPFWIENCVDEQFGGFISSLAEDGSILDDDKSVWVQGRFTWLLAEIFNESKKSDSLKSAIASSPFERSRFLELSKCGIDFLTAKCFDSTDGRMWFQVARDGKPIRKRRYSFTESFAAIAFGEYAKATGDEPSRERAVECFDNFLNQNDRAKSEPPKFTLTRRSKSLGLPMIAIATAQELRDSIGLERANEIIDDAIREIETDFLCEELNCVLETVVVHPKDDQFKHFDGRQLNPGHAIEAAWFIMEEGWLRSNREYVELGLKMLDWMLEIGWDQKYGGLFYFADAKGLPVQEYWHDMKFWWPHNELIIASLLAWKLTGLEKYSNMHKLAHQWAFQHFPDSEHGEWFGYLHRDGHVSQTAKGNLWKGPFHLPRMLLKCADILSQA